MSGPFDQYEEEPPKRWLGGSSYIAESEFGFECYQKKGTNFLFHQVNGPARSWHDMFGRKEEFYNHGLLHRDDGPAVIHDTSSYFVHPKQGIMGNVQYYFGHAGILYMKWYWQGEKSKFSEWAKKTNLSKTERAFLLLKYA